MFAQFSKFALIGAGATLVHYLVMGLLVTGLSAHPLPASTVGFACSALLNYWLNYHWTFNSRRVHRSALPRFVLVAGCGLCLNALIVWLAFDRAGLHWILAQAIATGAVLVWNFFVNKFWTFRLSGRPAG